MVAIIVIAINDPVNSDIGPGNDASFRQTVGNEFQSVRDVESGMNEVPRGAFIGLIGCCLSVYLSLPLFSIPPGAHPRLMGLNALAAALAVGVAVVGGSLLHTVDKQQSLVGRAVGWLLVLFPLAYLWIGWHIISLVRGFSFAG